MSPPDPSPACPPTTLLLNLPSHAAPVGLKDRLALSGEQGSAGPSFPLKKPGWVVPPVLLPRWETATAGVQPEFSETLVPAQVSGTGSHQSAACSLSFRRGGDLPPHPLHPHVAGLGLAPVLSQVGSSAGLEEASVGSPLG